MGSIEDNAFLVLSTMANLPRDEVEKFNFGGHQISDLTNLAPDEINDAVAILADSGLVEQLVTLGCAPYDFFSVTITARGRYEYERIKEQKEIADNKGNQTIKKPTLPIGSPYGFTDYDWETVADRKSKSDELYVSFGHQFKSDHYDSRILTANIEAMFKKTVDEYNKLRNTVAVKLIFISLSAGYGEHLFNKIAKDIIGSDIAVFETSDQNPNVMIEMGVALTWGVRVLPIKKEGQPVPPSDISGQTWVDYTENGVTFIGDDHERKLVSMIDLAARKKG